jgi:undecaprenyl-phosphate galactose phosphotransferase/putative colanic acid biosynthesis UDP-glucose lipid carrier transferase
MPFTWVRPAIVLFDGLLIIACSIASHLIYWLTINSGSEVESAFALGLVVVLYFVPINVYRRNYSVDALSNTKRQLREVLLIWSVTFLVLGSVAFLLKIGADFSHGATSVFYFAGLGLIFGSRLVVAKWMLFARSGGAFADRKILLIADREQVAATPRIEDLARFGYRATKILPFSSADNSGLTDEVIAAISEDPQIKDIVIAAGWEQIDAVEEIVSGLRLLPITIRLLPDSKIAHLLDKQGVQLGNVWTRELQRPPLSIEERAVKRSLDLILALVAGTILLPLMVVVACIIKLDSKGPVLFTQARNGFTNRTFRILKFRTLNTLEDGTNVKQVTRNDSRVTRVGRLLRQTSIDELPQLWNVIRGDMSVVGPRPHATAHNSQYGNMIANYAFRHHVKPGLTGWAQINGFRGEICTVELLKRRVELDLWYIDNWSLWLDVKIIAKTFISVLFQPCAY